MASVSASLSSMNGLVARMSRSSCSRSLPRPCPLPSTGRRSCTVLRAAASPAPASSLAFNHVLLTILDPDPFLGESSKVAVATAAGIAGGKSGGKVTVLVIEEPGTKAKDPTKQLESIDWHMRDKGCEEFQVLTRETESPASVLVGDVADEVGADLVVLSSMAVHAKHVDANQLAEFVSCPLLMLP